MRVSVIIHAPKLKKKSIKEYVLASTTALLSLLSIFLVFTLIVSTTTIVFLLFMGSEITFVGLKTAYAVSSQDPPAHLHKLTTAVVTNSRSTTSNSHPTITTTATTTNPMLATTPIANPTSATTGKNLPINITLTGIGTTSNPLKFFTTIKPLHGTLGPISSTGSFSASVTYTPKKDYSGTDSFWFKVRDSVTNKASSAAYVGITVS